MTTVQRIPTTTKYLNELTPHPENYNSHPASQIKELAESLSTFGQFKNIVTWTCPENMTTPEGHELHEGLTYILAGHGLWLAAMEAGVDELEIKDYSGLSYEMALGLLLVDNAAPLGSVPIVTALASLLERAREPMADKPRLAAMLDRLKLKAGINGNGSAPPEPSAPTEIEAERLAKQYGVNLNQVWSLGWHKLAVGDCEDLELRDRLFGDNRPRYGMHDPPYGINVVGSAADSGGAKGFGKIGFTGVTPVNYYAPVLGDDKPFNPAHLLEFCPDSILWGANYYADKLPSKKGWIVWDKKGREDWRDNFSDCELAWSSLPITTRIYRHVWMGMVQEGEREQRVHPTQKPTALFEKIMSELFVQDGIIADFYLGSGPTLLACERLNRTCYGFELSPNYAAVSIHRWSQLTGQTPRRAAS